MIANPNPPAADIAAEPGAVRRQVRRRRGDRCEDGLDAIAAEVPVSLIYNDTPFAVMMATPADLEDFARGFSLSEAIVADPAELRIEAVAHGLDGAQLRLRIPEPRAQALAHRRRSLEGRSGCGVCGSESVDALLRVPPQVGAGAAIAGAALARALRELRAQQPLNALTGATHAAAWAGRDGRIALVREDVGRHNALDKLIGALAAAGVDPSQGFAVVTSRASYEMAMKAAQAGIPLLAAMSAPTALAIALADSARLTLIGFARDDGYAVYTHPRRLLDDARADADATGTPP
ncbi:formate dehydrogenase accessory sulfurtransferase FdhD [Lysobacter firmicutimachus]|uniref:Sulfur carrier protein FdhD n=1 Tax=Lysobacter firmicutimachus TaxID=1792846 RepID=A0ABU8D1I7_9GAMM